MVSERKEDMHAPEIVYDFVISQEHSDRSYNHLHHTGYFKYLEDARLRIFEEQGMTVESLLLEHGLTVPVVRIDNARYSREVRAGDKVSVVTAVTPGLVKLSFDQRMEKDGVPAMSALVTCAIVDVKTGRPQRIPDFIMSMFYPR